MKQKIIEFLKKDTTLNKLDIEKLLSKPKLESQGDFSLPMFILAKELKKAPQEVAKEYQEKLTNNKNTDLPQFIKKIEATGPFLNFYLDNTEEIKQTLTTILNEKEIKIQIENPQKLLIEYPSPNTNKSLHLGHVRNILLGNALSKIFKKVGHDVIRICLNNDRGIALSKSMIGYQKFHSNDSPESLNLKPDEFVSQCYVRFGKEAKKDPNLDKQAQDMLVAWENGDKEVLALWKKILDWVFVGYKQTYKNYKLEEFD